MMRVMLCVVGGQNYSAVVARELGYSQSAAVQNLKKMERLGLVKGRRAGGSVIYAPEWKKIAFLLTDYLGELLKQEAEATSIAKNTSVNNRLQNIQNSLTALKAKPEFWKFVEAYFKALVQIKYEGSMQEAFALFTYDVPIEEKLKELFEDNGFDFIGFIKPRRSFLGRRVATQLEAQIREVTSRKN